jgi:hypothetical protein
MTRLCRISRVAAVCAAWLPLVAFAVPQAQADPQTNKVRVEYVPPKNPEHQYIYDTMKKRKALEKLQEIFSAFKIPSDLTLRTMGCDGTPNAWYTNGVVTVCYEYLDRIHRTLPKDTTAAGVTREDALVGQFFYVFAHETGHAMFDLLSTPVFGHAEDAADQFATYIMLQFGQEQAKRLIMGAAYSYKNYIKDQTVTVPLIAFADMHSAPAQRYYNLLCLGYGAHPQVFAEVVEKKYLPTTRAQDCQKEYGELNWAFFSLIKPHLDMDIAKAVMQSDWLPKPKSAPKPN